MNKTIIYLLLIFLFSIGLSSGATFPDAPENLIASAVNTSTINVEWDALGGVSNYSVCIPLPAFYNISYAGIPAPTIDGVLDTNITDFSQRGIIQSPNPVGPLVYESIWAVHDGEYLYMMANTTDDDTNGLDEYIAVYFDVGQNGLTTDDRGYRIREDGTLAYLKWSGSAWINAGATASTHAVGGSGTNNVVYEIQVPYSEVIGLTDNISIDIVVRRTNTEDATTYSYWPNSAYSVLTTDEWQTVYMSPFDTPEGLQCFNTSYNYYTVTGLDAYSEYRFIVAGINATGVIGNTAYADAITLDYPRYNITGTVYDAVTLLPMQNALVVLTDTFTVAYDTTDVNGTFNFSSVYSDIYTLEFTKDEYYVYSESITVDGADETDMLIYMEQDTAIKQIPLTMFYVLLAMFAFFVFMSLRGIREDGVYLDNIIFSAISMIFSFYLSKITINGTIVHVEKFITSLNTVVTSTTPVVSSSLSTLFEYVGILFVVVTFGLIVAFIQERRLLDE